MPESRQAGFRSVQTSRLKRALTNLGASHSEKQFFWPFWTFLHTEQYFARHPEGHRQTAENEKEKRIEVKTKYV